MYFKPLKYVKINIIIYCLLIIQAFIVTKKKERKCERKSLRKIGWKRKNRKTVQMVEVK